MSDSEHEGAAGQDKALETVLEGLACLCQMRIYAKSRGDYIVRRVPVNSNDYWENST
ncbi:MAG: hypothetical protein KHX56_07890 [Clostridiales bacterium]|nr:hypothetical protein [Clostridiales bacterium]